MSNRTGYYFRSPHHSFPDPVESKIETVQFLTASKCVADLICQCGGKVFSPVKYDMLGNVQKISTKYEEDTLHFKYINDLILSEQAGGQNIATDALLWLRRALQFIHSFFSSLLEDKRLNKTSEDLGENIRKAYKLTLERYHGWMAKQLFNLLSRMVPSRSQVLKAFVLDDAVDENLVFEDMEIYLSNVNSNITVLVNFYAEHNLDSDEKCK